MNQWILSNAPVLCVVAVGIFFLLLVGIGYSIDGVASAFQEANGYLKQIANELKKLSGEESSDE